MKSIADGYSKLHLSHLNIDNMHKKTIAEILKYQNTIFSKRFGSSHFIFWKSSDTSFESRVYMLWIFNVW